MTEAEKKARKADLNRKYREANPEKEAESQRKYREANREKIRESQRKYYKANRKRIIETHKQYDEANRKKIRERHREWRMANREKIRESQRKYCEANREKLAEQGRKYREANREKFRDRYRKYYEANREKIRRRKGLAYKLLTETIENMTDEQKLTMVSELADVMANAYRKFPTRTTAIEAVRGAYRTLSFADAALMWMSVDASIKLIKIDRSELKKDSDRIDWLADPKNTIGYVQLPGIILDRNKGSLRGAIDDGMTFNPNNPKKKNGGKCK